jgi:hypothetical protein
VISLHDTKNLISWTGILIAVVRISAPAAAGWISAAARLDRGATGRAGAAGRISTAAGASWISAAAIDGPGRISSYQQKPLPAGYLQQQPTAQYPPVQQPGSTGGAAGRADAAGRSRKLRESTGYPPEFHRSRWQDIRSSSRPASDAASHKEHRQ